MQGRAAKAGKENRPDRLDKPGKLGRGSRVRHHRAAVYNLAVRRMARPVSQVGNAPQAVVQAVQMLVVEDAADRAFRQKASGVWSGC